MNTRQRFSDLARLIDEDEALMDVAQYSVTMLSGLRPDELEDLQRDATAMAAVFDQIRDGVVETIGDDRGELATWLMAHGGVVADHAVHLWVVGGVWPDRVRALVHRTVSEICP